MKQPDVNAVAEKPRGENVINPISLINEEDDPDDAKHCYRHNREMDSIDPVLHHNGALYSINDTFEAVACRLCHSELENMGIDSEEYIQKALYGMFNSWDEGSSGGNWFKCVNPSVSMEDGWMAFESTASTDDERELKEPKPGTKQFRTLRLVDKLGGPITANELSRKSDIGSVSPTLSRLYYDKMLTREDVGTGTLEYGYSVSEHGKVVLNEYSI